MPSPSRVQLNSDAELTGLLNSDVIAHHSSASDHSDILSDPVELERELAQEGFHEKLAANEQATDGSRGATISYEKALERELEYQKRIKMIVLQHPVGSRLLPAHSQLVRYDICTHTISPPKPETTGSRNPNPPPEQQQQQQQQRPQYRQPSVQQLPDRRPLAQHRKPLPPGANHRQPLLRQPPPDQKLPNPQENPVWCYLCKVKCVTLHNLRAHRLGKKHKAKWDQVFGNKTAAAASTSSNS